MQHPTHKLETPRADALIYLPDHLYLGKLESGYLYSQYSVRKFVWKH
jgi:hypothetical protein